MTLILPVGIVGNIMPGRNCYNDFNIIYEIVKYSVRRESFNHDLKEPCHLINFEINILKHVNLLLCKSIENIFLRFKTH